MQEQESQALLEKQFLQLGIEIENMGTRSGDVTAEHIVHRL